MPDAPGIAEGFDGYRSTLADLGAVDFDEQIYRALEILLTDADARAAAQARCRRLLVDEFQDLTPAHLLLIRLLVGPGLRLLRGGRRRPGHLRLLGGDARVPHRVPRLLPRCRPPSARGQLPVPSLGGRGGPPPPLLQPPAYRQDHPFTGGPARPRTGGLGSAGRLRSRGRPDRGRRLAGRAGPRDRPGLAGLGRRPDDIAVLARVNSALLPVQVAMRGSRACPAPRRSGPRRWAAPVSAPPSPTSGSAPTPTTSAGRTSGTPSAGRRGGSPRWWWTC